MKIEIMRKEEFNQLATCLMEQMQSLLEKQRDLVYDYLNGHPSVFLTTALKLNDDNMAIVIDPDSDDLPYQSVTVDYPKGNVLISLEVIGIAKKDVGEGVALYWVDEYEEVQIESFEDMPLSSMGNILQLLMDGQDWYIGDVFYK